MFDAALPQRVDIGKISIAYCRKGTGQPLLYLHGCHGIDTGDPFIEPLSKNFDVVAPCLPGFGESELPRTYRDIQDVVDFILQFCATLGIENIVLVGSSFGGWVAAELSVRSTDLLSHMVLAAPLGARFTVDPQEKEILDIFIQPQDAIPGVFFATDEIGNKAFGNLDLATMPEDTAIRYCRNLEGLTLFGWSPLLNNPKLNRRLEKIDIPTLVLCGDQDKVVSLDYGRKYAAAIPGAKFEIIENAGHYLPLEQPKTFAEKVTAFAYKI